ncbi:MAG: hypothetical protein UHK60_09330 [Acutalibacteraceae bacterium]|nr:hypothetical protein [Acutalibacteraceae bacterium]
MKISITDVIDNDHQSHYWYGGECARIEYKGYTALIEAIGDVYAEYVLNNETEVYVKDKNNAGVFYSEMRGYLKNDTELYKAIENEELIFENNNWWEAFIIDPKGIHHDLMWALDASYLNEAVEEVRKGFEEMIKYIEEKN